MQLSANQNLILIEGAATYERILADVREVEIEEGLRHIKDFIKIYPDFAPAHNDLAVMYYQTGNALKALAHYEKAHKLEPANITYRKNLADFYFVELEWTGEAIHTYLDILKDNPFDTEALNSLGTISLEIGRREQARQYFTRTLQLDSSNHYAQQYLQKLPAPPSDSTGSKQLSHAIQQVAVTTPSLPSQPVSAPFQSLFTVETPPQPVRSLDELYRDAVGLVNSDKPEEAIKTLEMLLALDSNHALAHNDLGVLYQRAGALEKSRQHHLEAVRLQPASQVFQKNLADLLCSGFGALEEALEIYVKLFSQNRYDVETIKAIAIVCLEVGRPEDARFFLEQILAIKPWDQEAVEALHSLKKSS
jgi:Flp pilus assembly protein TadD